MVVTRTSKDSALKPFAWTYSNKKPVAVFNIYDYLSIKFIVFVFIRISIRHEIGHQKKIVTTAFQGLTALAKIFTLLWRLIIAGSKVRRAEKT